MGRFTALVSWQPSEQPSGRQLWVAWGTLSCSLRSVLKMGTVQLGFPTPQVKKQPLTSIWKPRQHDPTASSGSHQKPGFYHRQDCKALGFSNHVGCKRWRRQGVSTVSAPARQVSKADHPCAQGSAHGLTGSQEKARWAFVTWHGLQASLLPFPSCHFCMAKETL